MQVSKHSCSYSFWVLSNNYKQPDSARCIIHNWKQREKSARQANNLCSFTRNASDAIAKQTRCIEPTLFRHVATHSLRCGCTIDRNVFRISPVAKVNRRGSRVYAAILAVFSKLHRLCQTSRLKNH